MTYPPYPVIDLSAGGLEEEGRCQCPQDIVSFGVGNRHLWSGLRLCAWRRRKNPAGTHESMAAVSAAGGAHVRFGGEHRFGCCRQLPFHL